MIQSGKFTPGMSFHAYGTFASVQRIFQVDQKRLISAGRGCFAGQTVRQFLLMEHARPTFTCATADIREAHSK